jgi:hypothetical protein
MKNILILLLLFLGGISSQAQSIDYQPKQNNQGKFTIYWGWNRAWFTKSDITFKGDDYNFTLKDVFAKDRQSKFAPGLYFKPTTITIPQYNFRIGYFINSKYHISAGIDHMKYVVQQNQIVPIEGDVSIKDSQFNKSYQSTTVQLNEDFLKFEHTDGLNYVNIGLRRFDQLFTSKYLSMSAISGLELGVLIPRTNTTLLGMERYDEFHLSGYGMNAMLGINFSTWKGLFLQPEFKSGFINMPSIRTTHSKSDMAKQRFGFAQFNVVFGATISLGKKNKSN